MRLIEFVVFADESFDLNRLVPFDFHSVIFDNVEELSDVGVRIDQSAADALKQCVISLKLHEVVSRCFVKEITDASATHDFVASAFRPDSNSPGKGCEFEEVFLEAMRASVLQMLFWFCAIHSIHHRALLWILAGSGAT